MKSEEPILLPPKSLEARTIPTNSANNDINVYNFHFQPDGGWTYTPFHTDEGALVKQESESETKSIKVKPIKI